MSLSDDDLLSRVYAMSGATDDDDETRRLREIHTAYRSLPAEEPPERGLAELMAAARVKAEEMKPAPWWRVLFRPPVLALASVMVVVGGAVLIGRHGDSMKAESPTAPTVTTGKPDTNDLALDKAPASTDSTTTKAFGDSPAKEKEEDQRAKGGETPPTVMLGAGSSSHGAPLKPPTQAPTGSASHATPPPRPVEHTVTQDRPTAPPVEPTRQVPPPAPAPNVDPTSRTTGTPAGGGADGRVAPDDDRAGDKAEAAKDEAKKDAAAEPAPEATSQRRGGAGAGPRQPSIDQLVRQCQAAAARGDCAAAKALAARIAKDDAETYRSRVVKDEAIARCLK